MDVGPGRQQHVDRESAGMGTAHGATRAAIELGAAIGRHHFKLAQDAKPDERIEQRQRGTHRRPVIGWRYRER